MLTIRYQICSIVCVMSKTFADLKYTIKQKQVIEPLSEESWSIMLNLESLGSGKTKV